DDGSFEFRRTADRSLASVPNAESSVNGVRGGEPERNLEMISSDLVGILHFSKPLAAEGERLESDRELAFVEALGIRNPVRSRGPGRIAAILSRDGAPVDYGQPLFEIDRG
ncbi:MAG: biotin/lipoyl-containing protein, partial [Candidatus Baltobacteraceae bacterium]